MRRRCWMRTSARRLSAACHPPVAGVWASTAWQCSSLILQTSRCHTPPPPSPFHAAADARFPTAGSSVFPCHEARGRGRSLSARAHRCRLETRSFAIKMTYEPAWLSFPLLPSCCKCSCHQVLSVTTSENNSKCRAQKTRACRRQSSFTLQRCKHQRSSNEHGNPRGNTGHPANSSCCGNWGPPWRALHDARERRQQKVGAGTRQRERRDSCK
jgi:hypothetical protein